MTVAHNVETTDERCSNDSRELVHVVAVTNQPGLHQLGIKFTSKPKPTNRGALSRRGSLSPKEGEDAEDVQDKEHIVESVDLRSAAHRRGVTPGYRLHAVNGIVVKSEQQVLEEFELPAVFTFTSPPLAEIVPRQFRIDLLGPTLRLPENLKERTVEIVHECLDVCKVSRHYGIDTLCVETSAHLKDFAVRAMTYVVVHMYKFDRADHDSDMAEQLHTVVGDLESILANTFKSDELPSRRDDLFGKMELHAAAELLRENGNPQLYKTFCELMHNFFAAAYEEGKVRDRSRALCSQNAPVEAWQKFWKIKKYSSGVWACVLVNCLGSARAEELANLNLLSNPVALEILHLTNWIICAHNDICSLQREVMYSDPLNSVILLTECGFSLAQSLQLVIEFSNFWVQRLGEIGRTLFAQMNESEESQTLRHFWDICWEWVSANLTFTLMNAKRYVVPPCVTLRALSRTEAVSPVMLPHCSRVDTEAIEENLLARLGSARRSVPPASFPAAPAAPPISPQRSPVSMRRSPMVSPMLSPMNGASRRSSTCISPLLSPSSPLQSPISPLIGSKSPLHMPPSSPMRSPRRVMRGHAMKHSIRRASLRRSRGFGERPPPLLLPSMMPQNGLSTIGEESGEPVAPQQVLGSPHATLPAIGENIPVVSPIAMEEEDVVAYREPFVVKLRACDITRGIKLDPNARRWSNPNVARRASVLGLELPTC